MKGLGWNEFFEEEYLTINSDDMLLGRIISKSNSQYTILTNDDCLVGTVSGRFSYHATV